MSLFRTSALSGVAVFIKLLTSIFLNKILAIYVGPAGFGLIGQFQSLISASTTFASGAVNTGVTKLTAQFSSDTRRQKAVWSTAFKLGLSCTVVPAVVFFLARKELSQLLLGSEEYSEVFIWLAFALPLLVLNGLLSAILSGRKAVTTFVFVNIGGSIIGAGVAVVLVLSGGLSGALIALAIGQAVACIWTIWLVNRVLSLHWRDFTAGFDINIARSLGGFALMATTSALMVPAAQMIIRENLATTLGWGDAGLWQALMRISETHLLLLTSTLAVYFLPRFSEISDGQELQREVLKGYYFVVPIVFISTAFLFLLRKPLITLLLSNQFLPLEEVLPIQLVGDAFKIVSWVPAYTMISHAQTKTFVTTEIIFNILQVALTLAFIPYFGLQGTSIAYALTYAIYGIAMYVIFNRLVLRLDNATNL